MKRIAVMSLFIIALVLSGCSSYRVAKEDSFIPYSGATDIYSASREELAVLDLCDYPGVFGEIKTEKDAVQVAATVIEEVYGNDESPYVVKYNPTADAWIVNGSLPPFSLGGVASIAIARETGEILMLLHTQ